MENHNFHGKIHYKMAIFNSYVKLPEGKHPFSYGFPMVFLWGRKQSRWYPEFPNSVTAAYQFQPYDPTRTTTPNQTPKLVLLSNKNTHKCLLHIYCNIMINDKFIVIFAYTCTYIIIRNSTHKYNIHIYIYIYTHFIIRY